MLKIISYLTGIVALSILFGCATIRPINDSQVGVRHIYNKSYELGVKKSAYVGEEVIKVMDYYVISRNLNKIKANDDFTVSVFGNGSYRVNKGEVFNILGIIEESEGLQYVVMFPGMIRIRFCINMDGTISDRLIGDMNQKLALSPNVVPKNVTLEVVSVEEVDKNKGYINYEIVFTGITEKNISMLYREYTKEGLAREAFYQNITYPVSSKTIRFKNILLSVIEVTSEKIYFVVTRDGLEDK